MPRMTEPWQPREIVEMARENMLQWLWVHKGLESEKNPDYAYMDIVAGKAANWAAIYTACKDIAGESGE